MADWDRLFSQAHDGPRGNSRLPPRSASARFGSVARGLGNVGKNGAAPGAAGFAGVARDPDTGRATAAPVDRGSDLPAQPGKVRIDPENVSQGLMRLVLTLVELLRELLERQALRRIDGGSLMPQEIERLGVTFLRLSQEMDRLKQEFNLTDEDLNLDLGPLGKLR